MTVRLENAREDFARFWTWIGAEGDLPTALAEWDHRHNQTRTDGKHRENQRPLDSLAVGSFDINAALTGIHPQIRQMPLDASDAVRITPER